MTVKVNDLSAGAQGLKASFGKHVTEEELLELVKLCDAKDGDMVFIGTGSSQQGCKLHGCFTFLRLLVIITSFMMAIRLYGLLISQCSR